MRTEIKIFFLAIIKTYVLYIVNHYLKSVYNKDIQTDPLPTVDKC